MIEQFPINPALLSSTTKSRVNCLRGWLRRLPLSLLIFDCERFCFHLRRWLGHYSHRCSPSLVAAFIQPPLGLFTIDRQSHSLHNQEEPAGPLVHSCPLVHGWPLNLRIRLNHEGD